jgi:hypothetical protein
VPTFPRAVGARPRIATPPRFPGAFQSWSESGRGNVRSFENVGRTWEETFPVLDTSLASVRALIEAINRSMREPVLWDVAHPYWHRRLGLGGGTPLVNGANQLGSNLIIDGASNTITNWLRQGDLIQVVGCAVIFDVTADVNTDGSGNATIPISPPIFEGRSPADNAAVTIAPASILFKAYIVGVNDYPLIDTTQFLDAGLTLTWREQPQ